MLTEFKNTVLPITWFKSMPRYASPPAAEQTGTKSVAYAAQSQREHFSYWYLGKAQAKPALTGDSCIALGPGELRRTWGRFVRGPGELATDAT